MAELVPPSHARRLRCLGIGDPGEVAAVARGGGLGVLDGADPAALRLVAARVRVPYGVRTDGPVPEGAAFAVRTRAPWTGALAEVSDVATAAEAVAGGALGLLARGGELSDFILLQQLLGAFDVPVWGRVAGPRTAVGALAGGAAGVLLESTVEADVRRVVGAEVPAVTSSERLCRTLGSALPVVQGPMTRVSDQPGFAAAVADAGGFPFVAVATSSGTRTTDLLTRTAERLGDRPWGAGILGFVPDDLRVEQLAAIRAVRPRCVLIAGGKPGQVKALEADGIATFVHVPSPVLLGQYLDAGVRRFVFEGAECGGHVGPRSSFELWEEQLAVLGAAKDVEVVFAGGIHDARSAAVVTAMAAPLDAVGVLMGTAYLFTEEAVTHGAITGLFQERALAAGATVTLETAPGHRTRCLPSPYTAEFEQVKAGLRDLPAQEAWQRLEELNTGRLRVASKGVRRDGSPLGEETQLAEGMFMAGEVAVLRDRRTTIAELHREVASGKTFARREAPQPRDSRDIAVIGMACTFPGAPDLEAFWSNVLRGEDAVTEVPPQRWDPAVYFGQSTSKWGGFLPPVAVDPLDYGIPPAAMGSIDPAQLVSLETARRALVDAGYGEREFDRERTSVVFGAEAGGDLANAGTLRSLLDGYLDEVPPELLAQLPEPTEDTFPGTLANVISGRIANRLDLGGANYTVDAACGSSLAALDLAAKELRAGTSELVLCGAVDLHNGIHDYLMFTSAGALSPTGRCRPFDAAADGIALGEGVACLVLKRLSDAERDGDRIYAVVKGVGAASDGKALGLTAPRPEGQHRALERAYRDAGVSPVDVGLVEAHGTGTVVGDATELRTLTGFFSSAGAAPGSCVLGSVKSQIGHTKCAAGLAGLIKAALALWHQVVPPTLHLSAPNAAWDAETSPFTFTTSARPWAEPARLAGVSAFGFGGTNFHAVLGASPVAPDRRHGLRDWAPEAEQALADLRRVVAERAAERGPARSGATGAAGPGKVAFLFPGQGSQRPGMLADLFVHFPELADLLRLAPDVAAKAFPPHPFDAAEAQERALTDTRVAQPALGLVETAVADLLAQVGVRPDFLAGHSYGELVALSVAGAFDTDTLLRVSRARANAIADVAEPGTMAAVKVSRDLLTSTLIGPDVVVANHNAPEQVVLSGPVAAIERAIRRLRETGVTAQRIPVACAFHSPLVAKAGDLFAYELTREPIGDPRLPVWSNRTAKPYAGDVKSELAAQIGAPVRFLDQIEAMYDAGARTFVEVGPGRVLTRLVKDILGDRPHAVVACGPDLTAFLTALKTLAQAGVDVRTERLTRNDRPAPSPTAWAVDGRSARAPGIEAPALPPARRIRSSVMTQPAPGRDQAVVDFLRTTRELVAAQREVMLGYLGSAAAPVVVPEPVRIPEPEPERQPEPEPAADVLTTVIGVISERTGYPAEMIAGDLDLEADLSIDSIKRTEIAGTLLSRLGLPADDRTDQLSRDRTANALTGHLESWLNPTPAAVAPTRYRLERVPVPLDPDPGRLRGKTVAAPDEAVRAAFVAAGAEVVAGDADITVILGGEAPEVFSRLKNAKGTVLVAAEPGTPGLRGLVRSAALERDGVTRLVEVTQDVAKTLVDEALSDGPPVVGHDETGRFTIEPRPADVPSIAYSGAGPGGGELAALGLGPDSVVLMVGGARGIAARAAIAFAASGCRLELAGRTPWPGEPDDLPADPTAMRAVLAGRGGSVAEIERRVRTVLAQREIGRTLDEIRAAGGEAGYTALDVRDSDAVRHLVKNLPSRLAGVVFAAGVIDDKLMADKDETSFRAVYETKVDGARTLLDVLDAEPGFVAFFGSIAAVLGNRGQTDYAAANDALDALATSWPGRAVTVHWGPWAPAADHSGMVSPELAREYERRDISLLDADAGTAALLRELAYGTDRAVLYTASLW
ncbi:Acyl transferase domain-containing protein [Amycolatopsis pretoriensis]|uniref:Acyl transferase domain-containing protein n=1 Tax=Amycolatopsis pretoriensis TaxID=218821 RepID=A0A1H5QLQ3_9PSEU|nr:type I polyketide synthase [Amycolatopsis pretoriensis]SEF26278.1 Acyl transferase domain-containing protein [Amycolatopsis pretoriensis]